MDDGGAYIEDILLFKNKGTKYHWYNAIRFIKKYDAAKSYDQYNYITYKELNYYLDIDLEEVPLHINNEGSTPLNLIINWRLKNSI